MVFEGKKVLVIGGTGSLGGALVSRLVSGANGRPDRVSILSRDEEKQHRARLRHYPPANPDHVAPSVSGGIRVRFLLGDVGRLRDVAAAIDDHDVVINAAALKQVPNCEYNPEQAIRINCLGMNNIVNAIRDYRLPVQTVIGISTDKACEPINVMGMTKALQERMLVAANLTVPNTRFICVRYGNVMGSRGSVIPLFRDQIRDGGPVTVTDGTMTRFLISLDDAVDIIAAALETARPGEIVVPDAPSATVDSIALALIGGDNIDIREIGMRPGEKRHEIMISAEEAQRCVTRGVYHYVQPVVPELKSIGEAGAAVLQGELNSAARVLSTEKVSALFERHGFIKPRPRDAAIAVVS